MKMVATLIGAAALCTTSTLAQTRSLSQDRDLSIRDLSPETSDQIESCDAGLFDHDGRLIFEGIVNGTIVSCSLSGVTTGQGGVLN